ncbi:hypothetical protein PV08_12035 [Exophiala spinifera]|uniref:CCHC-type domain-containing protein n=1 Tax=Exophiala spinifera TaxID=91928 RepID=A0A0D1Z9P0_9EURO|nr:uncharacterized protein PV08_12035 [Exophiala spinifera]KIW09692.1 hypothetical protein PV08_12035 [Exophiala spinifera]
MAMGTSWPSLGAEPHDLKEHVTFLHEACAQLHAVKHSHTAIPTTTIGPIIDSTLSLLSKITRHLDEQPDTRLASQIQDLFKEQRDAQLKDHEAIKAVIKAATAPLNTATPPSGTHVASWAQVAAAAGPPPGHVTPPHTVLSSGSPSTLTAYKGREVIVKLLDHALAQRLRQLSPSQLKNKVNNILRDTPKVRDIKVAAAHQLKSGDITVITNSLDEATELQIHTDWARGLGPRAEVIRTTYGAIVHGIPVDTINMNDQQGTIQRVLADNFSVIPHAKITYVGWLTKGSTKKRNSSIVIEFTQPEMANAIIYAGFLWEGLIHNCQLYDRSCRIKQCLRCYDYGHIGTQCNAPQKCGHCAGGHESRGCPVKGGPGFQPKCALCGGDHTAWNAACLARQKEMQRVERAKQARSHYWPAPSRRTAPATSSHNEPGPPLPTSTSDNPDEPARRSHPDGLSNQAIREPRVLRSSRRQQQSNATLPTAHLRISHSETTVPSQQTASHVPAAPATVLEEPPVSQEPTAPTHYPPVPLAEDFPGADDWLQNLDFNWEDTIAVDPTPGISTIPNSQYHARTLSPRELARLERAVVTFDDLPPPRRGCYCEEHEHIYENWPVRDAELIIGTCMRECPYCSYRQESTPELRKHIRGRHGRRNLTVRKGKLGDKRVAPGWIALPTTQTRQTQGTAPHTAI